jgi:hypothetical protein
MECFRCTLDNHNGEYDGESKNNKMHGNGIFTFDDRYVYEGTFENGKRVGRGKLYFPDSESEKNPKMYEGFFNDDFTCDIEGKIIYFNGDIYEGLWNDGMYHGHGKYIYINGNIYEGNFENNKKHGYGKIIYFNGNIYVGYFKEDKMDGIGKMIYQDSIIKSITSYWIDENTFCINDNIKVEYDTDLLNKLDILREEIQSFEVFPNYIHKYIPVLGKKTKIAELKYVLQKKFANLRDI